MTGPLDDATLARLQAGLATPAEAIQRYRLGPVLGEGGMGTVYLGYDDLLEREVAIKVARTSHGPGSGGLVDRLRAEARVLARLEHPGIVPVHDAGQLPDGRVFYVMKRIRGQTLAAALAALPDRERRLALFERIVEPVAFAHQRGVVHRDLKPDNIMVGEFGEVLVTDWGVAKLVDRPDAPGEHAPAAGPGLTDPGMILGTPGFMPPEQGAGDAGQVDARADVFALGALLATLLGNGGPGPERPAARLLAEAPGVPGRLAAIAGRCLAGPPTARYPDAAALLEDFRRFRAGQRVEAYRESPFERIVRVLHPYRAFIVLVAAYLVMRVLVAWIGRR